MRKRGAGGGVTCVDHIYSDGYRLAVNSSKGAREMTAADLGLPLPQWDADWLNATYGPCPPALWKWLERPPASYAFWLGADHG